MNNQNRFISTPFAQQMLIVKRALITGIKEGNPSHLQYYRINGIDKTLITETPFTITPDDGLLIIKTGAGGGVANLDITLTPKSKITTPVRKAGFGGQLYMTLTVTDSTYTDILEVSANEITLIRGRLGSYSSLKNFRLITNENQFSCNKVTIASDYIFENIEYLEAFVSSLPATGTLVMSSEFTTYYKTSQLFIAHGWTVEQPVAEVEEEPAE